MGMDYTLFHSWLNAKLRIPASSILTYFVSSTELLKCEYYHYCKEWYINMLFSYLTV